jgi:hypothetical protein
MLTNVRISFIEDIRRTEAKQRTIREPKVLREKNRQSEQKLEAEKL